MTLFHPPNPLLPFKTYDELQSKLQSGECRLITSTAFAADFEDLIANLSQLSRDPVEIFPDADALRISEFIFHGNNTNLCVVGVHYNSLATLESHRSCNLVTFDFDLQKLTYAVVVRKNFPQLNQIRLALSFFSTTDKYERLLRKYAPIIGKRNFCDPGNTNGTPLSFWQLADALWIFLFICGAGFVAFILELKLKSRTYVCRF